MATIRFNALKETLQRKPIKIEEHSVKRSELFGKKVFTPNTCRQYMPKEAYVAIQSATTYGTKIDRKLAEQIASGMKAWAHEQ